MNECSHFLNLQDSISKMVFFVVKRTIFCVWYFDNDDNMKPFMVGFGFAAYLQRTNGKKHFEPFQSFQKHLLHLQYFVGFSLFGFCIIHIQLSQNIRNRQKIQFQFDELWIIMMLIAILVCVCVRFALRYYMLAWIINKHQDWMSAHDDHDGISAFPKNAIIICFHRKPKIKALFISNYIHHQWKSHMHENQCNFISHAHTNSLLWMIIIRK